MILLFFLGLEWGLFNFGTGLWSVQCARFNGPFIYDLIVMIPPLPHHRYGIAERMAFCHAKYHDRSDGDKYVPAHAKGLGTKNLSGLCNV